MSIKRSWWLGIVGSLGYLAVTWWRLTSLPVFADEAIYIRWAQLIIDDWSRYLFFPMNDGKTPLFVWLMVPALQLFNNPVWAARLVSVLGGFVQIWLTGHILKTLGAKRQTQWLGMLFMTVLPYWYFHHRMALMDGWLATAVTGTLWALLQLAQVVANRLKTKKDHQRIWQPTGSELMWIAMAGGWWGLAWWLKLPAILIAPLFVLIPLWPKTMSWSGRLALTIRVGAAGFLGLCLFVILRVSPVFGQLFARGSDFLYPLSTVLAGGWTQTLPNLPTYAWYFVTYLTWPICLAAVSGWFSKRHQRTHFLLWGAALGYAVPIALLGRVVYPRYLLPAAVFLTISAALVYEEWLTHWVGEAKTLLAKTWHGLVIVGLIAQTLGLSTVFMVTNWYWPDQTPFVSADRSQYLEEWSSGHGIVEAVQYIQSQQANHSVAVATEGYFGTLPDALLLYFFGHNVDNLMIEGIGQPVVSIPAEFWQRSTSYQQVLLVVNSHRLQLPLAREHLRLEVCRPNGAPCLQVWDITTLRPKN